MSDFDFRDLLGGASATVSDPDVQEKITKIGEAMLPAVLFLARLHQASLGDVIAAAMSKVALSVHIAGHPDAAVEMLRHVGSIAQTVEQAIADCEEERRRG